MQWQQQAAAADVGLLGCMAAAGWRRGGDPFLLQRCSWGSCSRLVVGCQPSPSWPQWCSLARAAGAFSCSGSSGLQQQLRLLADWQQRFGGSAAVHLFHGCNGACGEVAAEQLSLSFMAAMLHVGQGGRF